MRSKSIAYYVSGVLSLFWMLAALTCVILASLLVWSILGQPPTLTSTALEIRLSGFNFRAPSTDPAQNLVIALPVALESTTPGPSIPEVHGDYRFRVQKGEFLTMSLAMLLILTLLALAMLDQLWHIFHTLQIKDPFRADNVSRIRRIAWAVIAMEVIEALATAYWSAWAESPGFRPASRIGAPGILYGVLILALAEVFREGARLREEQSLTI